MTEPENTVETNKVTGDYYELKCDYCGVLTPDPWHSSGLLNGNLVKHIHSCDECTESLGLVNCAIGNLKETAFLAGVVLAFMKNHSDDGISDEIITEAKKHPELASFGTTEEAIVNLAYKHLLNYAASKGLVKEAS